jgi:SAM-dependent methyltransferase
LQNSTQEGAIPLPAEAWPLALYRKSILKQRKFREITSLLGSTDGLVCLDIGGDNGVISYLLRQRGGMWKSADLDTHAVAAIRELVGDSVFQIGGHRTPFANDEFDRVVIVDFLEHIPDDHEFAEELFRIIKPGGELILNVPLLNPTLLRKFRHFIGQTDEQHGHLRPGYAPEGLRRLLRNGFDVLTCRTYSKFFSEAIDTFMTAAISWKKRGGHASSKGMIVTRSDFDPHDSSFRLYSLVYPLLWILAKLDLLLFWTRGYMLILKARVRKTASGPVQIGPRTFGPAAEIL